MQFIITKAEFQVARAVLFSQLTRENGHITTLEDEEVLQKGQFEGTLHIIMSQSELDQLANDFPNDVTFYESTQLVKSVKLPDAEFAFTDVIFTLDTKLELTSVEYAELKDIFKSKEYEPEIILESPKVTYITDPLNNLLNQFNTTRGTLESLEKERCSLKRRADELEVEVLSQVIDITQPIHHVLEEDLICGSYKDEDNLEDEDYYETLKGVPLATLPSQELPEHPSFRYIIHEGILKRGEIIQPIDGDENAWRVDYVPFLENEDLVFDHLEDAFESILLSLKERLEDAETYLSNEIERHQQVIERVEAMLKAGSIE